MAQYKVPQDVEADDKLIGPFSFRQFVYLLIAGGLVALAIGLYQIFPLLAIIPVPFILFFIVLALPLRKDQPMETYLAAIVSYYLKPHNRLWMPGQRESTVKITAPKVVEESRARDITGEEATHRLSFLSDIVDTGGYAIKGAGTSSMKEEVIAEANATSDMFENNRFNSIGSTIEKEETERHEDIVKGMREAIERNDSMRSEENAPVIQKRSDEATIKPSEKPAMGSVTQSVLGGRPEYSSPVVVLPEVQSSEKKEEPTEKIDTTQPNHSIMELANNPDFSVATIAKEANRINEKSKERDEGEVFISLH